MMETNFPNDSLEMDHALLSEIKDADTLAILSKLLSTRSTATHDTHRWCVALIQDQLKTVEKWLKDLKENDEKEYIYPAGLEKVDERALEFGVWMLKELLDSARKKKTVYGGF